MLPKSRKAAGLFLKKQKEKGITYDLSISIYTSLSSLSSESKARITNSNQNSTRLRKSSYMSKSKKSDHLAYQVRHT